MSIPTNTTFIQDSVKEYFDINMSSVSNPAALWTAHKAFIHGALIQLNAQAKHQRTQQLTELLDKIGRLETINKTNSIH